MRIVLITGAGASVDFGFPLGPKLYTDLMSLIDKERHAIIQAKARNSADLDIFFAHAEPGKHPFRRLLFEVANENWAERRQVLYQFIMSQDTHTETIDQLVEEQPEFAPFLKAAIAWLISTSEFERRADEYIRKPVLGENWIKPMITAAKQNIRRDVQNLNVTNITFNYDETYETRTKAYWGDVTRGVPQYDLVFKTIHVFGKTPPLRDRLTSVEMIARRARDRNLLRTITETNDSIPQLANVLEKADRICILGFGFAQLNLQRIGLDSSYSTKIYAQSYASPQREIAALDRLAVPPLNRYLGSKSSPMTCKQAVDDGLFGLSPVH